MHLLQAVFMRRRVLHWLLPLIALWVVIVCGLAFSGAASADARIAVQPVSDDRQFEPQPFRSFREARSFEVASPPPVSDVAFGVPADLRPPAAAEVREQNAVLIDGDPLLEWPPALKDEAYPFLLEKDCPTPMSLMLHSAYGPQQMRKLAREIVVRGLLTTTYREIAAGLERGACPVAGSLVVSLDDFPTDWLRAKFVALSEIFAERGLVLVIGAVVRGPQDPDAWAYLQHMETQGFEVASHTIDHYSLSQIEPERIERQVSVSYDIICENLGRCPNTLILPFGNVDEFGDTLRAAQDYTFVVGIPGGRHFEGAPPFYVGRIGPGSGDVQETLSILAASFGPERFSSFAMRALDELKNLRCVASPGGRMASPHFRCSRLQTADARNLGAIPQQAVAP